MPRQLRTCHSPLAWAASGANSKAVASDPTVVMKRGSLRLVADLPMLAYIAATDLAEEPPMSEKRMRVHIGLSRALQAKLLKSDAEEIEALAKRLGLDNVNSRRLKAFGILSADVEPETAANLRSEEGVDFVELDSEKKAI